VGKRVTKHQLEYELERVGSVNGWGGLLVLASILAVFSVPFVFIAILMRLVGRIGSRALITILSAAAVLWVLALVRCCHS
jgi:hypothetical protein